MWIRLLSPFFLLACFCLPLPAQELEHLAHEMVFGDRVRYSERSYQYFMSLLEDRTLDTQHIERENGVAISPKAAAECMSDPLRTQLFVRGLYQAVQSLDKDSVHIFYVGSGPLAPFMTLTAPLLPHARYTLVEISENAARTAEVLIKRLELEDQLVDMIVEDATQMRVPEKADFDIIITETMDAGLNSEMMIPILINLMPQLPEDIILLPENVELTYFLTDYAERMPPLEKHVIFDARDLIRCYLEEGTFPDVQVIPKRKKGVKAFVGTRVQVYEDLYLEEEQSWITRKLPVRERRKDGLVFSYITTPPKLIVE